MFLPYIYKEWNKRRGHGEKIKGLGVLFLSWLCYMGVVHFSIGGSLIQFLYIAGSVLIATLIIFMWFWGSKFWDTGFDSSDEDGFFLAELWASRKYKKDSPEWKRSALWFINIFKYTLGYSLVGLACLNPLIPFIGLFGGHAETIYNDAFHPHDKTTLDRAETNNGLFSGYLALVSVGCVPVWYFAQPLLLGMI